MRKWLCVFAAAGLLASMPPAAAQDDAGANDGTGEVVVTGTWRRRNTDNVPVAPPFPAAAQMLRRTADFAIQQVIIVSDTVDDEEAKKEVIAMVRRAIERASGAGVQVASGELVVEPLTTANIDDLKIVDSDDDDDDDEALSDVDGQYAKVLVKAPLAAGIDAKTALAKIDRFIKAVPAVGRAEIKPFGELTLSVVNPEQYRGAIIDLVAKDTAATGARFGPGYGVEVSGLDRPVLWKRMGLTEVQLYLPATSTIRPRD